MRELVSILLLLTAYTAQAREPDGFEAARRWASENRVALYSYHLKYIGPADGYFAPIIRTRDGGFFITGTTNDKRPDGKRDPQPVVAKLDGNGDLMWLKSLSKRGFVDFEAASAAETGDGGFTIYVLSYITPTRCVARFVRTDRLGKVVWERQLRGKGRIDTPFPTVAMLSQNGALMLMGHIGFPREGGGDPLYHRWEGEIDARGKVVRDEVKEPNQTGLLKSDRPW